MTEYEEYISENMDKCTWKHRGGSEQYILEKMRNQPKLYLPPSDQTGIAIVKWMSCVHPTHSSYSTISGFSMKLRYVPITQLRKSRQSCQFQGHLCTFICFLCLFGREYFATECLRDFQALREMLFDHWTNSS